MSDKYCIFLNDETKINLQLYPEHAPISVRNFQHLVEKGFYEGLCFHRVIPAFMIQGGGFSIENGQLKHKEASTIKGEFASNKVENQLKHTAGTLSMARTSVKDSASSQFFICAADCDYLDGEYAAFGRVCDEESMANVIRISKIQTGRWMHFDDVPVTPVIIQKIEKI